MARIKVKRSAGEPTPKLLQQNWPVRIGKVFTKRSVPTLMKTDPAKDQAGQGKRTAQHGVNTGTSGGFKGRVNIVRQKPVSPPSPRANTKTVTPPRQGRLKRR